MSISQEDGGTLIGVEWYQTHGFYVFDTVAFAPFQPFL
jgi:hypothetical protein